MIGTLWGTRGSLPAAGTETVRYGGNTACAEVRGADGTLLVLDAGTGIRRLGATLGPEIPRVDLWIRTGLRCSPPDPRHSVQRF